MTRVTLGRRPLAQSARHSDQGHTGIDAGSLECTLVLGRGIRLADLARMLAQESFDELLASERPTIPAPAESGICLKVTRIPWVSATVDVVTCDLSRDPRSECYGPPGEEANSQGVAQEDVAQNERPPSTSIVRALK